MSNETQPNEQLQDDVDATRDHESQSAQSDTERAVVEEPVDLEAQLEEANRNYLRAKAEVENVLKRTRREIEEQRRYAALPMMRELLVVVDNIHRAIEAAQKDENSSGLLEGVKMVGVQLGGILEQHGCKPIQAVAEPFDPHLHEAIGQEPSDEVPANHITRELQAGYQLHDRVVRPSQVFVSTGPADNGSEQP